MALARYSDRFWFPSGVLAVNIEARVFPEGSNTLASLFTDASGMTPLANPAATDGTGTLTFWAESGNYWVHLDTESFLVNVGMTQEQADLSTGIASGGGLSINNVNPQAINISPVDGYIVTYIAGSQAEPVITRVKTQAQTVSLNAAALLRTVTWWLLDAAGTVIQQADRPTSEQRRTHIVLGVSAFDVFNGVLFEAVPSGVLLPNQANQLADLMDALGAFSLSGNLITPNGVNLSINKSSGKLFARGFNHATVDGLPLIENPHVVTTPAQNPVQFRYGTRSTTAIGGPPVTTVDVANFDSGGVVTPIGGAATSATIHRVWLVPAEGIENQVTLQYGQVVHANIATALDRIGQSGYTPNPGFAANGAVIAYIVATRTATNLSDPAQAVIIAADKFSTP